MHRDLVFSENYLLNSCMDFSATYMAVSMLEHDLRKNAALASPKTVGALHHVIIKRVHSSQRQSYFLYRKAAKTLSFLGSACEDPGLAAESIKRLKHIVADSVGPSHRAASEALGSLPLRENKENKGRPLDYWLICSNRFNPSSLAIFLPRITD